VCHKNKYKIQKKKYKKYNEKAALVSLTGIFLIASWGIKDIFEKIAMEIGI